MNNESLDTTVENVEQMDSCRLDNPVDVQQQVIMIVSKILDFKKITLDTKFEDIGADSISFIKIVVAIEEKFNIEFDDDFLYINVFPTAGTIVEYIKFKLS